MYVHTHPCTYVTMYMHVNFWSYSNYISLLCHAIIPSYCFSSSTFKETDAFVGYHKDTPAAVIFEAADVYKADLENCELSDQEKDAVRDKVKHIYHMQLSRQTKWSI